jgi:hypothetical protein
MLLILENNALFFRKCPERFKNLWWANGGDSFCFNIFGLLTLLQNFVIDKHGIQN